MNKAKKITVGIILTLVALILAFTLVTYIIHMVKTNTELDALKTFNSTATISECDFMVENAQKAFNTVITNNVPKLYICASWGFETGDDFVEYTKWINRQKEKNNLGEPMNENPDKEVVNKVLQQCEESRQSILIPYLEKMGNCQLVCLGGDHMIYQQKPTECGNIIKSFVDCLDN